LNNAYDIATYTIDEVQEKMNLTANIFNAAFINEVQELIFTQIDNILDEFVDALDKTEDLMNRACYTFPTQVFVIPGVKGVLESFDISNQGSELLKNSYVESKTFVQYIGGVYVFGSALVRVEKPFH
jgi:hypothetical protein